jgi:hypothetical protein
MGELGRRAAQLRKLLRGKEKGFGKKVSMKNGGATLRHRRG